MGVYFVCADRYVFNKTRLSPFKSQAIILIGLLIFDYSFCVSGEQFEEPKVIGASLSLRTKERLLQVWLSDGRNTLVRTNVSNKIRHLLNLDPDNVTLYYKEHIKSIKVSKICMITHSN